MSEIPPEQNLKLIRLMSRAVNEELLVPAYHPVLQIAFPERRIFLMQCSLQTETGQLIPYATVRGLAKLAEMSLALDRWLMHQALLTLKELHGHNHPDAKVIVPQSMKSLSNTEYPRWLERQQEIENVSTRGLVVSFRLSHVAKNLKPAKKCFSALHKMGIQTMIEAFTDHPAANKVMRAMGNRYISPAKKLMNADDGKIQQIIESCHSRGVMIFLADIEHPKKINLIWSKGTDLMEGQYIHPPLEKPEFQFPSLVV